MVAGGHGAVVVSHHAADTIGAGNVARGSAGGHGAVVVSHHAANNVAAGYIHVFQRQVLHRATGVEEVNHPHIASILVDSQPRDGMVAAVEGAGVSVIVVSYRRPLFASKVDVVGQCTIYRQVIPCGFVPRQQPVGVVNLVGPAVSRQVISLVLIQRDVVELARLGGEGGGEVAFLGAVRPQFLDFVAGHHVRLPAGDGCTVFGIFALLHLYPALLRALSGLAFFISTLCIGIELEGGYLAECIGFGRDGTLASWWVKFSVTGVW